MAADIQRHFSACKAKKSLKELTSVTPTSCNSIAEADDGGRKHDGRPELAHHKGGQGASDEQALNDVADRRLHYRHAEHRHGAGCQEETVSCMRICDND